MPHVSSLAELTLETRDLAAMERFYRDVVGLCVLAREEDRIWLGVGERTRLGLWSPGEKEFGDRGGGHVHFAFSASPGRLDALTERLRAVAVGVHGPVEHPGGDRSIYFRDPAGNVVETWDFFEQGDGAREGVDALRGAPHSRRCRSRRAASACSAPRRRAGARRRGRGCRRGARAGRRRARGRCAPRARSRRAPPRGPPRGPPSTASRSGARRRCAGAPTRPGRRRSAARRTPGPTRGPARRAGRSGSRPGRPPASGPAGSRRARPRARRCGRTRASAAPRGGRTARAGSTRTAAGGRPPARTGPRSRG
jgi:catechol 2,3-dioxygenase-like lactoylglutathione lyase family enzyme